MTRGNETPLIRSLVDFCCQFYDKPFPNQVIEEAKLSLIDYFSAMIWGTNSEYYDYLLQYSKSVSDGKCSVIGLDKKTTATEAAFINSIVSHSMEIDDIHLGTAGLHPGVTIIPTVMAVAEQLHSSGGDVIKAIIIGYEVAGRIGKSISPSHRYKGFHATGTIGVFGSAAAAAFLKKLTPEKFANALSIAASQAGGTFAFLDGGVGVKYLHAGNSAKNGIQSAHLSELGFTGPSTFLEHPEGFAQAYASANNLKLITDKLGESFEILNVFRKKYFMCGHICPAVDAISIHLDILSDDEIENIKVNTYKAASVLTNKRPTTFPEAKFSIPYCISSFINFGEIKDCFKDVNLMRKINGITDKIEVFENNEYTYDFPEKRRTLVEVLLKNKEIISGEVEVPKGTPENPYNLDDIAGKLSSALENKNKKHLTKMLLEEIGNLEKQPNISALMSHLSVI